MAVRALCKGMGRVSAWVRRRGDKRKRRTSLPGRMVDELALSGLAGNPAGSVATGGGGVLALGLSRTGGGGVGSSGGT